MTRKMHWLGLALLAGATLLGCRSCGRSVRMAARPDPPMLHASEGNSVIAFAPPGGGFCVQLPGEPERSVETISSIVGPQRIVRYRLRLEDRLIDVGYLERTDHPLARMAGDRRVLNAAVQGTLDTYEARATTTRDILLDSAPGRDVKALTAGGSAVRMRLVLTRSRIYHVIVVEPGAKELSEEGSRLFESFELASGH
jgi:hypothetical protein